MPGGCSPDIPGGIGLPGLRLVAYSTAGNRSGRGSVCAGPGRTSRGAFRPVPGFDGTTARSALATIPGEPVDG